MSLRGAFFATKQSLLNMADTARQNELFKREIASSAFSLLAMTSNL